ncbi:hypothetical protein VN21_16690 [Paraclostridium benzoelyticum]|uniref:Uncharacterized protein n=1 Tax=Paraclostridium benzoelyticum TaxID=1629550 RepID=A0A0M3DCL7_9FIRM|nr:hypothetical protein [Paraclostridium benzoelyticum]KKY00008.1 hypothetical protein VN21_16690 [Paraclostridium benzoelyticum]MDM8129283.1 hypothetical protein [Paraclostridium benzoelyticum]OXX82997.1 hypothetical protein AVM15_14070 [Paraclostridium benzoelyticum]
MVNDVLPTIVIYLNRKFDIELDEAIKAVKKSKVLKACNDDSYDMSLQEWLGKFLNELGMDIDTDKEVAKKKIKEFIK